MIVKEYHDTPITVYPHSTNPWGNSSNVASYRNQQNLNGCNINSTSNASFRGNNNNVEFFYYILFNPINLPTDATVESITCSIKGYLASTGYFSQNSIQLCYGNEKRGVPTSFNASSSQIVNITNGGEWTNDELSNLQLYVGGYAVNNYQKAWIYLYGINLNIYYSTPKVVWNIDSSIDTNDATISSTHIEVDDNDSFTLTITPTVPGNRPIYLFDNQIDVTSSLVQVGNNFTYTISNVNDDHTLFVQYENVVYNYYDINISTEYSSILSISNIGQNSIRESLSFKIDFTSNTEGVISIYDNNVLVNTQNIIEDDLNIEFSYIVTNIHEIHNIAFNYRQFYNYTVTAIVDDYAILSPSTPQVYHELSQDPYILTITTPGITTPPIEITDNGIDISNLLIESELNNSTDAIYPSGRANLSNITQLDTATENNMYTSYNSTTFGRFSVARNTNGSMYFTFPQLNLPTIADTLDSISITFKLGAESTIASSQCQGRLYYNTTAKGSNTNLDLTTAGSIITITATDFSINELSNIRLRLTLNNNTSSRIYFNFYGADLIANYTIDGAIYTYTINSITQDHLINIRYLPIICKTKINNNWYNIKKENIYCKISDNWINLTASNAIYIKINNNWKLIEN